MVIVLDNCCNLHRGGKEATTRKCAIVLAFVCFYKYEQPPGSVHCSERIEMLYGCKMRPLEMLIRKLAAYCPFKMHLQLIRQQKQEREKCILKGKKKECRYVAKTLAYL